MLLNDRKRQLVVNPIMVNLGVFWIAHTHGAHIRPAPYESVISKDMDLKFGILN